MSDYTQFMDHMFEMAEKSSCRGCVFNSGRVCNNIAGTSLPCRIIYKAWGKYKQIPLKTTPQPDTDDNIIRRIEIE